MPALRAAGFLLFIGFSFAVRASEAPVCLQPISFALYENGYIYDATTDTGIDKDFAEELSRRSGCRFEFTVKPRARIWHELETGTLMMTGSGIQTEARSAFAWSIRYMAQKNYVLVDRTVAADSGAAFLADESLRWSVVRAYRHGDAADHFLDDLRTRKRVFEEPDLDNAFRALARNRTQALMAPPPAYAKYLKTLGLADKLRIEDWFVADAPIPHGLFLAKKHFSAQEWNKWKAIVGQMRSDGTLKAIYRKHLDPKDAERMLQYLPD